MSVPDHCDIALVLCPTPIHRPQFYISEVRLYVWYIGYIYCPSFLDRILNVRWPVPPIVPRLNIVFHAV